MAELKMVNVLYKIIIMTSQKCDILAKRIKRHNRPEDNLYGYHDFTVQRAETSPRRGQSHPEQHSVPGKLLREVQWRQQWHHLLDGCLHEQWFLLATWPKRPPSSIYAATGDGSRAFEYRGGINGYSASCSI